MQAQTVQKISGLRANIESLIPDSASADNIWTFFGWDEEKSNDYMIAKAYGIDLRPVIAPVFSDVVSLVIDGVYIEKGHTWDEILNGQDPEFVGITPKARMLSVVDHIISQSLHS